MSEEYYTFNEDGNFLDSSGQEIDIGATAVSGETIKISGGKDAKKTKKPRPASFGKGAYMSYPIARTMQETTGDTLRIKCIQYTPPSKGQSNFSVKGKDLLVDLTLSDGTVLKDQVNTAKVRKRAEAEAGIVIPKPKLGAQFTDANTRMRGTKSKYNIELPMPQEVNDSNNVGWGDDKMNAIQLAGLSIASKFMEKGVVGGIEDSQAAIRAMMSGATIDGLTDQTMNAVRAAISGAAMGALGQNISAQSVIARSTGQILNNNLELLFQGMALRTFPYSITFSPRSSKEARVVKAIIRSLKQSMSPRAGEFNDSAQGIFLKSPDVFQLEYLRDGKPHPFLNRMKLAALTGMNVNYTNSGTYTSYSDGTPVNMRMDLTFKELNPIYAEDYLPGNGGGEGVGY